METIRSLRWVFSPRNTLWACAYVMLVGLKPYVQAKVEHLLELAPTDFLLIVFGLVAIYLIFLPKQVRGQLKDLWQGGEERVKARRAIEALEEFVVRRSDAEREFQSSLLPALCAALLLFQAGDYEKTVQAASSALQDLEAKSKETA